MHHIKTIEIEYQEIDTKIDALSVQWDSEYENWQNQVITSEKYEELNEMFNNQLSALYKEREILYVRMTELKQASNAHGSTNGQESKIEVKKESENNIEESDDDEMFRNQLFYSLEEQLHEMLVNQLSDGLFIDDVKKLDDEICQFNELIETKNHVAALLQVQQQLEEQQHLTIEVVKIEVVSQVQQQQQQEQVKSRDNKINLKMVGIYQMEEKLKQSVIDEIEGQIIKPDEINMSSKGTLDQDQIYVDSVKKTDTFRGGT